MRPARPRPRLLAACTAAAAWTTSVHAAPPPPAPPGAPRTASPATSPSTTTSRTAPPASSPTTTPPSTPASSPPATAPVPAALQLEWTAPPACPSAAAVRTRIEAALRRPTVADGAAATRVQARVSAGPRGYALVLETRAAGSAVDVRRMDDRRCAVLADATAVIVATAIDEVDPDRAPPLLPPPPPEAVPDLSSGPAPADLSPGPAPADLSPGPAPADLSPGPAPADLSPGPAAPDPADDLPRAPAEPSPAPRLAAGLRLAALADRGSTPGLAGGLTGGVGLLAAGWRVDLAAVWVAARPTAPVDGLDVTASVGLLAAQVRACAVPRLGRLEFPTCLGFEAGGARGRGRGSALAVPLVDWRPWLAPVVGTALAWPFTRRLALVVHADLVVPLTPVGFEIGGLGPVYSGSHAAGRAGLGLEVKFP